MSDMKTVCLIPARGGSKRLHRKNVLPFCDKPLVAWSIIQARKSCCFGDDIWVSTDDAEIAKISKEYGAKVVMRPDYLALDGTMTFSVVQHFLYTQENLFDNLVLLQPTNPLRQSWNIRDFVKKMSEDNWNLGHGVTYGSKGITGLIYGMAVHYIIRCFWKMNDYEQIYKVSDWQTMEIDYREDFNVCESLFKGMGLDREVL